MLISSKNIPFWTVITFFVFYLLLDHGIASTPYAQLTDEQVRLEDLGGGDCWIEIKNSNIIREVISSNLSMPNSIDDSNAFTSFYNPDVQKNEWLRIGAISSAQGFTIDVWFPVQRLGISKIAIRQYIQKQKISDPIPISINWDNFPAMLTLCSFEDLCDIKLQETNRTIPLNTLRSHAKWGIKAAENLQQKGSPKIKGSRFYYQIALKEFQEHAKTSRVLDGDEVSFDLLTGAAIHLLLTKKQPE